MSDKDFETWVEDEKTNTINTFDVGDIRTTECVVYSIDEKMGQTYIHKDQANTLAARDYKQPQAVCLETGYFRHTDEISPPLKARDYKEPSIICYWDGTQVAGTLTAHNAGGGRECRTRTISTVSSYQKTTGTLMAKMSEGYCGQDAYSDMLIVEEKKKNDTQ